MIEKIKNALKFISKYIKFFLNPVKYAKSIGVKVGEDCSIMSWRFGSEPWLIELGNHVRITSNVRFVTHDGGSWVLRKYEKYKDVKRYGKIVIKDNSFIGNNVIILPGVTVGPNSIIGAGAVVAHDIPEGSVAVGVPAKVIMSIEEYAEKSLASTPNYNKENLKKDYKKEILYQLDNDNREDE